MNLRRASYERPAEGHRPLDFFFRWRFFGEPARASDNSYASRSQSVSGSSTSSRCLTGIVCTSLDFEARSTRRTCGALSVRPRNTQSSRKFLFGRTKK